MARAKTSKNYYYVLVFTAHGAVYVTSYRTYPHKEAEWKDTGKPLEMTREDAKYMAVGLTLNGSMATVVCSPYEVEQQPYCYDKGGFVWKWNEDEEEKEETKEA